MTDGKPVENKPEAPKAADAPALAEPNAAAAPSSATSRNRMKLWLAAGGAVVALAGGVYGLKHFTAQPGKANAQTEPPAVAQSKQEPPPKIEAPELDPSSTIKPPTKREAPADDISVPDIKPSAANKSDTGPPPLPMIEVPPVKPPTSVIDAPMSPSLAPMIELPPVRSPAPMPGDKPGTDIPTITVPTVKPVEDKKPATADTDLFKAPDPLPTKVTDNDKPKVETPIIPIKGEDPKPPVPPVPMPTKKDDAPAVPEIDIKIPAPPMPMSNPMKTDAPPAIPELTIPAPPVPSPAKTDNPPVIGPSPMPMKMADPPSPPVIPVVPPSPPVTIDPPSPMPGISAPPPPPAVGTKPEKKDMYDEDWHTQREGDTYAIIAYEYLKDKKYAAALEAYNRDRYKPSERIIRVPPPWVLEEQFPNLINPNNDLPKTSDITTTGGTKDEPAPPKPVGARPAPPAANDEYRVSSPAGETIREIAQKVYGNGDAWRKLWDLNPSIDPTQPIPTGTALRLGR